jgi:signal transduction histidine kinase
MILGRTSPAARIAVVHRDAQRAHAVAGVLRRRGHQVSPIDPGRRAAQQVVASNPDLVIAHAGIREPRLVDLVRTVRQAFDIPVLVLTDGTRVQDEVEADALLREPVDLEAVTVCAAGLLRAEDEIRRLRRKVQELGALYRVSWAFSLEGGAEPLFTHLAEQSASMLKAEKGLVMLYDASRRQIVGQPRGFGLTAEQISQIRYSIDSEAAGRWNFRKNGPLISNSASADTRLLPNLVGQLGLRSALLVPMSSGGKILGLLGVANRTGDRPFGEEDLSLLMAAAGLAAVAVDNLVLHEDLKQANVLLQDYDRMKSEFVAMVAHDFRKPLTAIRGFAELVMEEEIPRETLVEYMRTVVDETDSLARLADDTLLITRIETERFEFRWSELDLGPFILGSVPLGLSDHSVLVDIPPGLPKVVVDPERLRQVLTNLVSNAIKYSPNGGTVTVRCRERGEQVTIEVVDHGLGIPQEQLGTLFQKFQRVRTDDHLAISGTGLGLYICRLIVEGHGGQVWVESQLGEGSTFGLVLPLDAREAQSRRKPRAETGSQRKLGGSITGMFRAVDSSGSTPKVVFPASTPPGSSGGE